MAVQRHRTKLKLVVDNKAKPLDANLPIRDARKDLVLHITEADIKGAQRKKNGECAAAHALCRQEHFRRAKVFKTKTYVEMKDGRWLRYCTPGSLYTELMIFDRGGRMEAGDFILRAPKGIEKLGAHTKPRGPHLVTGRSKRGVHFIEKVRDHAPKGGNLFRHLAEMA